MANKVKSNIYLKYIDKRERAWIDSLKEPFNNHNITADRRFEIFTLIQHHHEFNPFNQTIFYLQQTHIGEKEDEYNARKNTTYYINQPIYKPTGILILDTGYTFSCVDGYLHDSSGNPAMNSPLFGSAYYLHGSYYEPFEYFSIMEDQRKHRPDWFSFRYPDYNHQKYIDFMANTLGSKGI